jgi:transglutaminase-like putative cysteine protease
MTVLASLCLVNVFLRQAWILPAVGAVVVVAGSGHLARRTTVWRWVVPLASAGALLGYLVLAFARDDAAFGVFPSPPSVRALVGLARLGREEILAYSVPIAPLPGTTFLTVVGVGATALAVDTLAVTLRRVALSAVPLAGFYAVPLALTTAGVPWAAFAVAAGAYLTVLLIEARERVGRWGRAPQSAGVRRTARRVETGHLAVLGRRVGVAVVGAAVVLPVMLPGVDRGFLTGSGPGSGNGPNTISVVNPILTLGQDLRRPAEQEVLRYRTTGGGGYLRIVGLDAFDGESWEPSRLRVTRDQNLDAPLPTPEGLAGSTPAAPMRTTLSIGPLDQKFLPVRYPAARIEVAGEWLYDRATANIFSGDNDTSTRELSYTVAHLDVAPTPEQLRAAPVAGRGFEQFLDLPDELPEVVAVTAREVTAAADTAYDEALTLQTWLRSPEFRYDIHAPDEDGASAVVDFLDQRRGYCIHFASTMAVMARSLGIPARVAVGFTAGRSVGGGEFVVTTHDAHAWPELYFPGAGWLAFEPTPSVRTGEPPGYAQGSAAAPRDGQAAAQPSDAAAPLPAPQGGERPEDRGDEGSVDGSTDGSRLPVVPIALVMAGATAVGVPALVGAWVRRRRWRRAESSSAELAEAAWADIRATVRDLRGRWPSAETPRQSVDRLVVDHNLDPGSAQALRRLGQRIERARYAPAGSRSAGSQSAGSRSAGSQSVAAATRGEVDLVRAAMFAGAPRRARLRAHVVPTAYSEVMRALGRRVADGLGAADNALSVVGNRFKPRRG